MSVVQDFSKFLDTVSEVRKRELEGIMVSIMHSEQMELPPEIEAEIMRRAADPNPTYATRADLEKLFGKPLPFEYFDHE